MRRVRGAGWEATLEGWHTAYRREELAVVHHIHVRRNRQGKPVEKAPVDFLGTVRRPPPVCGCGCPSARVGAHIPTGRWVLWCDDCDNEEGWPLSRPIAFDAKEVGGPRFPFGKLEHHQGQDLEAHWLAGAIAGLAVRCSAGDFWVPWERVREAYHRWRREGGRPASVVVAEVGVAMSEERGWVDAI